jgi:hypothetical protein
MESLTYEKSKPLLPLYEGQAVKVVKVIDGDTIWASWINDDVAVRYKLRIRGIDTPELRSKNEYEKELAKKAKNVLQDAVMNKIIIVSDISMDKYGGRVLCDFSLEGIPSISEYMLTFPEFCHVFATSRLPWPEQQSIETEIVNEAESKLDFTSEV